MPKQKRQLPQEEVEKRLKVWMEHDYSATRAAVELGITRRAMDMFLDRYVDDKSQTKGFVGTLDQTKILKEPLPSGGRVKRYLITCAQNNTKIHEGFFKNLEAYADAIDAQIKISTFVYLKNALNTATTKKGERYRKEGSVSYDERIRPYIDDEIRLLAPTLAYCGNLQISPTAVNPCSGLNDYTGSASSIIPHTKIQMRPVGTPRNSPTKHLYTSGACTLKNYIEQKAGQKAEFHHTFGALIVEVMADGNWFIRQISADRKGNFFDVDKQVKGGKVTDAGRPAAIHWGDIHVANIDPTISLMFWGDGGVLDTLRPKNQLFHDLVDGESHNHHAKDDYHYQYSLHKRGRRDVRAEFDEARRFVDEYAHRSWCQGAVIWSNHDEFLYKWLRGTDYRSDYENAVFILELERECYRAMEQGCKPQPFRRALATKTCVVLTDDDDPYVIAGVSAGYHGHVGSGGSRGSVQQFATMGLKTTSGHSHAAMWINGATSAGTCSKLDLGYNKGFSTWSHSFVLIHPNGKRQIITANAEIEKWRA